MDLTSQGIDKNPLIRAASKGRLPFVQSLLGQGANVNTRSSKSGAAPLHLAAFHARAEVVGELLKQGANKDALDDKQGTPLHWAAMNNRLNIVAILLDAGADFTIRRNGKDGATPVHVAAHRGFDGIVSALLQRGADKNARDNRGDTALICAASMGRLLTVQVLVTAGADVNIQNSAGDTALSYAAHYGFDGIVASLIQTGEVDLNVRDSIQCDPPLTSAARRGHLPVVKLLLAAGADLDICVTSSGYAALTLAAGFGYVSIVLALLQHGAHVNTQGNDGYTPLHYLCQHQPAGGGAAADLLLRWGADETALNNNGNTPSSLLYREGPSGWPEDQIVRVRLLLARAPADRAWRRRSWLVMLHARASEETTATSENGTGPALATGGDGGCDKVARTGGNLEGKCTTVGGGSGVNDGDQGPCDVVTSLVALELDGVFRAVVSFL